MDDYQKRYEEQARMQDGGQALVEIETDPNSTPCTICGDNSKGAYVVENICSYPDHPLAETICVCLDHTLADIIGARIKVRLYR